MSERVMDETERVTVRVPVDLLDDLDRYVERSHYVNRSEFIREQLREGIENHD